MTLAQLDQVQGFSLSISDSGEVVRSCLPSTSADPAPPGRDAVATKQSRLYLDGVLPVSILRRIDGTEDNHVVELRDSDSWSLCIRFRRSCTERMCQRPPSVAVAIWRALSASVSLRTVVCPSALIEESF